MGNWGAHDRAPGRLPPTRKAGRPGVRPQIAYCANVGTETREARRGPGPAKDRTAERRSTPHPASMPEMWGPRRRALPATGRPRFFFSRTAVHRAVGPVIALRPVPSKPGANAGPETSRRAAFGDLVLSPTTSGSSAAGPEHTPEASPEACGIRWNRKYARLRSPGGTVVTKTVVTKTTRG